MAFDAPEVMQRFARANGIAYPLLADPESEIIRAFNVQNEAYGPGTSWHGLAHPMAFVIDADGIVRHRFSEASLSKRPQVEVVMEALRSGSVR